MRRLLRAAAVAGTAVAVSTAMAAAAPPPSSASTEATASIVLVVIPGQDTIALGELSWPSTTSAEVQSFSYPRDGSIVSVGLSRATVSAQTGATAASQASAETIAVSLFGGEILAGKVTARASAGAGLRSAGADVGSSAVQGLHVLDQDVSATRGASVPLADWGTLQVLVQDTGARRGRAPASQGTVVGLRVRLSAAHGGLPAGSEIVVGSAGATAVADVRTTAPEPPRGVGGAPPAAPAGPRPPEPDTGTAAIPGGPVRAVPVDVTARLTAGGYVFPVFGTVSYGDSFGAPRADVPGGWHHGEDIFASEGTPVLAVADGTVYSIGFIPIGGYRLWLKDESGNQFYYAHLSAYSPLAVEGKHVEAGDVIGFVGDTGDADGGAPHLHFEIHPAAMVGLGYDGVVAPYQFLVAWQRSQDAFFAAGRVYVPSGPGGTVLPPPGAVLLQADDIASLSGLVPGALERALERKRG